MDTEQNTSWRRALAYQIDPSLRPDPVAPPVVDDAVLDDSAKHEAAHAVVAHAQGLSVGDLTIGWDGGDRLGCADYYSINDDSLGVTEDNESVAAMQRGIVTALASFAADANPHGCADDLIKAIGIALRLHDHDGRNVIDTLADAHDKARALLSTPGGKAAHRHLAGRLRAEGHLGGGVPQSLIDRGYEDPAMFD